jgi:hypothetical protein
MGTYPPWTDPSYWNEGLQSHFRLKPQIETLVRTIPSEIRLLLLAKPGLVVGILVLVGLVAIARGVSNRLGGIPPARRK